MAERLACRWGTVEPSSGGDFVARGTVSSSDAPHRAGSGQTSSLRPGIRSVRLASLSRFNAIALKVSSASTAQNMTPDWIPLWQGSPGWRNLTAPCRQAPGRAAGHLVRKRGTSLAGGARTRSTTPLQPKWKRPSFFGPRVSGSAESRPDTETAGASPRHVHRRQSRHDAANALRSARWSCRKPPLAHSQALNSTASAIGHWEASEIIGSTSQRRVRRERTRPRPPPDVANRSGHPPRRAHCPVHALDHLRHEEIHRSLPQLSVETITCRLFGATCS